MSDCLRVLSVVNCNKRVVCGTDSSSSFEETTSRNSQIIDREREQHTPSIKHAPLVSKLIEPFHKLVSASCRYFQ